MKNSVFLIGLLCLCFSYQLQAHSVAIVDASEATYLELLSSEVHVTVNNQVATVTSTQEFRNNLSQDTVIKYGFPLPDGASATGLRWRIGQGLWQHAIFTAVPQDTTLPGGGGGGSSGNTTDPNLTKFLGENPMYFNLPDFIPQDSIITIQINYVELLPYAFSKVSFIYPNDYSLIQQGNISQNLVYNLQSQRSITALNCLSHNGAMITNNGNQANLQLNLSNQAADQDYEITYELNANEYGLFGFSTLMDSADIICDELPRGFCAFIVEPDPSDTAVIEKVFTLIIDRSGSMGGTKIRDARDAATFIMDNMNDGDHFNIVDFSSTVTSFRTGHVSANASNIASAKTYISRINSGGGTNISGSFSTAIPQFANSDTNVANIIIFLTDGLASTGITSTPGILSHVSGLIQTHEVDVQIFSFGIGNGVNKSLLSQLATQNGGFASFLENQDLTQVVTDFYLRIQNPVLLDISMNFSPNIITETYPVVLPNLYKGNQLIVVGRYAQADTVNVNLSGNAFGNPKSFNYDFALADTAIAEHQFLSKLWAKKRMEHLLRNYYDSLSNTLVANAIKQDIIDMSLCYGISSIFTSFIPDPGGGGGGNVSIEEEIMEEELGGKILAYPNPFRDEVHFRFQLDAFAIEDMSIIIYDLMGRKIRELKLVRNAYGDYELIWDGKDEFGQMVEPGQYMVQLQLPDRVLSTKIVKW